MEVSKIDPVILVCPISPAVSKKKKKKKTIKFLMTLRKPETN